MDSKRKVEVFSAGCALCQEVIDVVKREVGSSQIIVHNTMLRTAKTNPETFFATCARLLPKDVELTIRQHYSGLDESDLMILRAIRDAIPDANARTPQAVLEFTLNAIRAHGPQPLIGMP